jgi:neutral ceramidase
MVRKTLVYLASAFTLVAILLPGSNTGFCGNLAGSWKAGVAQVRITPQQPVWMAGYAARKRPSEGTAQELFAKALALEDGGRRLVIVTSDILGFTAAVSESIAGRLKSKFALKRDQLLFTSSHTHSGPVVRDSLLVAYDLNSDQAAAVRAYTAWLGERVVEVVGAALADMKAAELSYATSQAAIGVNRRQWKESGFVIGVNPQGPVDHQVSVLKLSRGGAAPFAVLFSAACHNTTLGGNNYLFHGDYAGVAQDELQQQHPGLTALFMLGCAADTNPEPRGTLELVRQHGHTLAAAVETALAGPQKPVNRPLATLFERVDLPFTAPPSRGELESRLLDKDVYRQRNARMQLIRLNEKGRLPRSYAYPIQVVRFGSSLTLVALAGEVVVDYCLRLQRELGTSENLWTLAYANDVFAYIPSKRVLAEGGYEAETSMLFYGWHGPWAPEIEDRLITKVNKMVHQLRLR